VSARVLIVDDQELMRTGFRMILEAAGIAVVGEAADGRDAVKRARELRPDVVLMDVRMPGMDGIEATRAITGEEDAPKVIILTMFDLDDYVYGALRAGASGFLLKDAPKEELIRAIGVVATGDALLAPGVTRRLIAEFAQRPQQTLGRPDAVATLTQRELDVFRLVAQGRSNSEIAADLVVSDATVKTHVAHILTKLGLRDRVQAVVLAYEQGVVKPGERARREG
jgi:DNA-binding NarL/FixJ family response regulator